MPRRGEVSRSLGVLVFLCATLAAPLIARAQVLSYNSEAEKLGAAHVSPESTRRVLKAIQSACATRRAGAGDALARELSAWEARHSRYLGLCSGFRAKLDKAVADAKPGSDQEKQLVRMQAMIRSALEQGSAEMAKGPVFTVESAAKQGGEAVGAICADFAKSVAAGKWELKRNDPELAAFFDKQK